MMKRVMLGVLVLSMQATAGHTFAPANFSRPYDNAGRLPSLYDVDFKFGARLEYGDSKTGLNSLHQRRNVLALQDDTQSALAMIRNRIGAAEANTTLSNIERQLGAFPLAGIGEVTDDGTRGHQQLTGRFQEVDTTFYGSYHIPFDCFGALSLGLFVPVVWKKIDKVSIKDLTVDFATSADEMDRRTKTRLTNDLVNTVKIQNNLDLSDWDEAGVGDIALILNWSKLFCLDNDFLKRVVLMAKLGVLFPSGKEKDEDRAFSMPLGSDGAYGMPFGLGFELLFPWHIKFGADADVTVLFDKTRVRRLKTDTHQTEFLLLNKGRATKEYGLTWQAHAFFELFHFWHGLSAKIDYQWVLHEKDKLRLKDSGFESALVAAGKNPNVTINALNGLKKWEAHNLLFSLSYDFCAHKHYHCDHRTCDHKHKEDDSHIIPQLQFFYKLSLDGRNMIDHDTVGGQLAISF